MSLLVAVFGLAQPLVVQEAIARVENGTSLGLIPAVLAALVLLVALISSFQRYILSRTGEGVVYGTRRRLIEKLMSLSMEHYDSRRRGDLIARVSSDSTLLRTVLTQGLVELVGGALTFIGAFIAMLLIDYVLLLTALAIVVFAIVVAGLVSRKLTPVTRATQNEVGRLAANLDRSLSAIRTIRASNATARETATVLDNARSAQMMGVTSGKIQAIVSSISGLTTQIAFLAVLGVGGVRVAAGNIEVSELVAFILFLFMFAMPLGQVFGTISVLNQALGAIGRIDEVFALSSEADPEANVDTPEQTGNNSAIEFSDVWFRYPDGEHDNSNPKAEDSILKGVTFRIPIGKRTAIVGPSGSGKSTILALIERFYDVRAGAVRVNGTDVRSLDRGELRQSLGYVEQDAPVLAGSLRDNLLLAAPTATNDDCRAVMNQVNLASIVERAPLGLDSPVGESGVMLSGGERQRLAMARTLLSAPPILLLDESTSHLDGMNEYLLRNALDAVATGRTLVVVAHRLSTIIDSDQIIVLDDGVVVGSGTHDELIESSPLYKNLASRQMLT